LHPSRRREAILARWSWKEYSHYGLVGRFAAGASRSPLLRLRSYIGSDMLEANPLIN